MSDSFLFIGLPYLAVFIFIVGSVVRFRMRAFSYSSLSTQFLEDKWLAWASMPWHIGIIVVLLGHVLAFGFPGFWSSLVAIPYVLLGAEVIGLIGAILALLGLIVLLTRRFVDARLQAVTSILDVIVLVILLIQVSTGLTVAVLHRWGAVWAPGALGPYLQGIVLLKPDVAFVQEMPPFVKMHIACAWLLLALFPFTRLVHALSFPFHYFARSPQKVVWNATRSAARFEQRHHVDNERRLFLKASLGVGVSLLFLSFGTLDKFFRYFFGQSLSGAEQEHILSQKIQRLKQSAAERELELERLTQDAIYVAKLSELSTNRGKYFIDYQMNPALAFLDEDGLPILISAKCTHLGCTVSQNMNEQGQVLCPCHVSYFSVKTGQPSLGSPAKAPLAHLGWVLKDAQGQQILTQDASGRREGAASPVLFADSSVYIVKRFS